jgi:hypothetical protein
MFTFASILDLLEMFSFLLIVKLPMHLKSSATISSKFWYLSLVGSFKVSQ